MSSETPPRTKRALTMNEVLNSKTKTYHFEDEWLELIGEPEQSGSWIIWGGSSVGKTTFALQLAVYLSQFGRVLYNSLEEGIGLSIKNTLIRVLGDKRPPRLHFLDREDIDTLRFRLSRHKAPRIIIIDSLQYTGLIYPKYMSLLAEFPNTLFIFISHEEGKQPEGRTGKKVRFNSDVKIRVEGFRAFCSSRFLNDGDAVMDIWPEGAAKYWGE